MLMSRAECINRGLFFGPDDTVDLESFRTVHPVELPDGRRFRTEKCALWGLKHHQAVAAERFWAQEAEEAKKFAKKGSKA